MFSSSHATSSFAFSRLRAALPRIGVETLLHLDALRRQRSALKELDAHLLRDIGVTREEANAESHRSVWDVPATWRL
ncbi:MAG: DUF1127 domain-containing protein [Dinoroseobacter sp.]|nr:DUF1127 domain-containing protein [Dinoroseobacter sp.]